MASMVRVRTLRTLPLTGLKRTFVSAPRRLKQREEEQFNPTDYLFPVFRPAFWNALIPSSLQVWRKDFWKRDRKASKSKGWNPATFYIWIFMIIGSNAINTIGLKSQYLIASRKADIKIAQLKEVLEKVQRGEDVDVARALGTGDEQREQEWKDVIRGIEEEDRLWHEKAKKKAEEKQAQEQSSPKSDFERQFSATTQSYADDDDDDNDIRQPRTTRRKGFY